MYVNSVAQARFGAAVRNCRLSRSRARRSAWQGRSRGSCATHQPAYCVFETSGKPLRASSLLRAAIVIATRHRCSSGTCRGVIMRSITSYRDRVMDRHSALLILASGNHGGALVFTIGVGVVLLIAIYMFAKGRR